MSESFFISFDHKTNQLSNGINFNTIKPSNFRYSIIVHVEMLTKLLILLFIRASFTSPLTQQKKAAGCNINISKLSPQAVVVSGKKYEFLYPQPSEASVFIPQNSTVIISCPGGSLTSLGQTIEASCISQSIFQFQSSRIDFNTLKCSKNPYHTARYTGNACPAKGREIEIGFVLNSSSFARQIIICFDDVNLNALYSFYNLTKSIGHHESGVPRPSFIEDSFYKLDVKVNDLYVRKGQKKTINALLGLEENSTKYIKDNNDYYLARGHLTAKADFVYATQQTATFHYVNVAPQWQTFNGDNWNTAEMDVRDYAERYGLDLEVYTGIYGVASLPHEVTGRQVPLYLYTNGKNALAVPELFWKVVYDRVNKLGVVLLGLNNPYKLNVNDQCYLCGYTEEFELASLEGR